MAYLFPFRGTKAFKLYFCSTCKLLATSMKELIPAFRFSPLLWNHSFCTLSQPLRRCWNCNSAVEEKAFFCRCGKIQPLEIQFSYFDALGYPSPVVRVNPVDLAGRMRSVQKQLHPDKFTGATQSEQRLAGEATTFVNQAYSTLVRPLDRFTYILSLHGLENEVSSTDPSISDPELLSKVMEINESVARIGGAFASAVNVCDVPKLQSSISELVSRIVSDLIKEEEILVQHLEASRWMEAHQSLVRFRYYCRSLKQISEHELSWKKLGINVTLPSGYR